MQLDIADGVAVSGVVLLIKRFIGREGQYEKIDESDK
jgi:hypothetical protein